MPQFFRRFKNRFSSTLAVLAALLVTALVYLAARLSLAAYFMYQAQQQAQANHITQSYELQQKALKLNPLFASYQRRYALTNLALATALTNKTELTQEEQAKLPELVKQAVRASKNATQLQSKNPTNWQILGQIYANLLDVIPQADQFAIEAYLKALELDPTNPALKLKLGKVFYQKSQFSQGQKLFEIVINHQPPAKTQTLAEAYYYLANSQRQQEQYLAALKNYEKLLPLLEPGNEDFKTATEEMQLVQQKLTEN